MAGNTTGQVFRLTTFGESHGAAIGGIIDGCPAGLLISEELIQAQLDRRKPGQSRLSTQRKEEDQVELLSGIFVGKSTGAPIGLIIKNKDARSKDYSHLKDSYRPSHADYTYEKKYGIRDYRGGGRSSARETACRVVGGAIAGIFLAQHGIRAAAYVSQVGNLRMPDDYRHLDLSTTENSLVRCPDPDFSERFIAMIDAIRKEGDTLGGVISCVVQGMPAGLGEPVFDKLHADLGKGMLSINAVKGFEIGSGFAAVSMRGSEHNDPFEIREGEVRTSSNRSGGIQGGISNGEDLFMRIAFKPVATIMKTQSSVSSEGEAVDLEGKGRHDPCVVPRAVPIVEAMANLILADHLLRQRSSQA